MNKQCTFSTIAALLIIVFSISSGKAQSNKEWPSFHGPERTNKSTETGLLTEWPESGLELLLTIEGLGEGYSSVSIANGYLFTAGMLDNQTYVFAFDLKGKLIWKKPNGKAWSTNMSHARSYTGSRSTPTYDNGVLYHLGETGRLAAFDHKTGVEKWSIDLREKFGADIPEYGYAESVLIDGNNLFCNPAGKKGFMVCLNKNDGKTIWVNTDISGVAGYSSPVIALSGGIRQLINYSSDRVYGVEYNTGKLLWSMPFENMRSLNNTDPIFLNNHVFITSGYGKGSELIRLNVSGNTITPEVLWKSELLDNHHGGVILHEEHLYGAGSNSRGWFCLDFYTGEQKWKSRGKGSITFAENMLYCVEENGVVKLVKANPGVYSETGTFKAPKGGTGPFWAHPVVCDGRLYIRHTDKIFVYNVAK